ncbi:EAL domain-containing response regulator [Vibrio sp. JC009]|uniref:EAL domain-containing response regulator n=1 Tax=Vibrio sp. JC009 TaxID=2912314 RepID=UPI0023B1B0A4|nr:EAL domain-containing response regulator [Vibrio sp. JC009]WED20797.1 EAL domain-containing response regulator [Vibrio sp. JC009]
MPDNIAQLPLTAIVIDDDDFILQQTAVILKQLGIKEVTGCIDGEQALSHIDSEMTFDIAIIDLNMPVMDGIEVLRNLAERDYSGAIILLSGEDERILRTAQNLANAHKLKVIGAIAKPLCLESLQNQLKAYRPPQTFSSRKTDFPDTYDELSIGLEQQEIIPYFQPQVRVSDKSVASVEILARWMHPESGLVPPGIFIPIAEEHGIIDLLTEQVLKQALAVYSQWRKAGYDFTMGMNLSADSLDIMDLPEKIAAMCEEHEVPCESLVLEITEGRVIHSQITSLDVLTRLRLKGFKLSIDDFGTHYSNMAQLNNIPFTELKIDREFVHKAADNPATSAILETSIQLAKKLNMTTVAEGVEDQADWDHVASTGCDLVQGYFIARPASAEDITSWLKQR